MTLLALAAPLGACVTRGGDEPLPVPPIGYNFAYLASQREAIGLIQAFDDGAHTYLQFKDRSAYLSIRTNPAQAPLPYQAGKRYITLDGVYDRLELTDDQASATLVNEVARPAPAAADALHYADPGLESADRVADSTTTPAGVAAVGVPEAEQTMKPNLRVSELNREIGDLEDRVRILTEALVSSRQRGGAPNLFLRTEFNVPRLVVRFDDNSDDARIDEDLLSVLGAAARAANRIYLHGHTDAFVASDAGTQLAIRRAISVRRLLVAQEVAPQRIRLFYRGAGNFIANNSTPEGKAANRRVEIELRKW